MPKNVEENAKKAQDEGKKKQEQAGKLQPMMNLANVDQELKARAQEKDRLIEQAKQVDTKLEREIAETLYNRADVRKAGQEALSRVSTLLIRYNRLKEGEARTGLDLHSKIRTAEGKRDAKLAQIEEEQSNLFEFKKSDGAGDGNGVQDPGERDPSTLGPKLRKRYDELEREKKWLVDACSKQINELVEESKDADGMTQAKEMSALKANINDDRSGGILSSLMLGGNAMGSKGYTLTTGDTADMQKGSAYIQDVSGEKGTLFSQMSLLDNAVNTSGVTMTGDVNSMIYGQQAGENNGKSQAYRPADYIGSSAVGAQYSLGDVLRSISDDDIRKMNEASGEKMNFDMDALKQSREENTLDEQIGIRQNQKSIAQAAKERGISEEAKQRKQGKIGGVNDLLKKEKGLSKEEENARKEKVKLLKAVTKSHKQVKGFWGSMFGKPDYVKDAGSKKERSQLLHAERVSWQSRMRNIARMRANRKPQLSLNPNDTAANSLPKLDAKENEAAEQMAEGSKDKSVRNMIASYRLMGATPEELYKFRLAIIAYMVPSGKKTLMEILKESEEAGYKGNEDLSSMQSMYRTFLEAPIVNGEYINNFMKKQPTLEALKMQKSLGFKKDKVDNVLAEQKEEQDDEKKLEKAKKSNGSLSTLKELRKKEQDRKEKKDAKLQKWISAEKASISEAGEEDEDNEDYNGPAKVEEEQKDDVGPLGSLFDEEEEKAGQPENKQGEEQKEIAEDEKIEQEYEGEFDNLNQNDLNWDDNAGVNAEQIADIRQGAQDQQVEELAPKEDEQAPKAEEPVQQLEEWAPKAEEPEEEIEEIIEYDEDELERQRKEAEAKKQAEIQVEEPKPVEEAKVEEKVEVPEPVEEPKVEVPEPIAEVQPVVVAPVEEQMPVAVAPVEEPMPVAVVQPENQQNQPQPEAAAKANGTKSYTDRWAKFRGMLAKSTVDIEAKKQLADSIMKLEDMLNGTFVKKTDKSEKAIFYATITSFDVTFQLISANARDLIRQLEKGGNQYELLKKVAYKIGGRANDCRSKFKKNATMMLQRLHKAGKLGIETHTWGEVLDEPGNAPIAPIGKPKKKAAKVKKARIKPSQVKPIQTKPPRMKPMQAKPIQEKPPQVIQQMEMQEKVNGLEMEPEDIEAEMKEFFAGYADEVPEKKLDEEPKEDVKVDVKEENLDEELANLEKEPEDQHEENDPIYPMLESHIRAFGRDKSPAEIYKAFIKTLSSDEERVKLGTNAQLTSHDVQKVHSAAMDFTGSFRKKAMKIIEELLLK